MLVGGMLLALQPLLAGADDRGALQGAEQRAYLDGLRQLYLADDERRALLAHGNALLETYALRAGYQVGQTRRQDWLYQLSVGEAGELILREESRDEASSAIAVRHQRLSVYGADPFIRYECPPSGVRCVLFNPLDGSPLLSIVRDHSGAAELAKALSFLIRNLQKG
ncbi:hypothetical protein NCCP436_22330 [Pseudomonas sp. NCCP-436]|nr:hypothetical protein NCCP436_22330 [Pseudomonas sp. NCCP-436]